MSISGSSAGLKLCSRGHTLRVINQEGSATQIQYLTFLIKLYLLLSRDKGGEKGEGNFFFFFFK